MNELFLDFVVRMMEVVGRIFGDFEVGMLLIE